MPKLRDYQSNALRKILRTLEERDRALAVMASGLGKTILAAYVAKVKLNKLKKSGKKNPRCLFLCHENGILDQARQEFEEALGSQYTFGSFNGEQKSCEAVNMLFATFQSMISWKEAHFQEEFDFIIVDESHHSQAPTYRDVIEFFKAPKLGITATPDREDQADIREIFGEEVVNISIEEGMAMGWLAKIEYHLITDDLDTRKLKKIVQNVMEKGKKISIKQLNETIFVKARDEEVARIIKENTAKGEQTIIFCESIHHADDFRSYLPGAECYHSGQTNQKNSEILAAFRRGELQYILAIDKFNEGIDIPQAEVLVFLRCTDSKNILLQQLGRGLRKAGNKYWIKVLDFVANCERVIMVHEMAERVRSHIQGNNDLFDKNIMHVKGDEFDFIFMPEQIDVLEVLHKLKPRYISDIPLLAVEYHPGPDDLPAEEIKAGTSRRLPWKCSVCSHKWMATGRNRILGSGCPACCGRVATPTKNMAVTHPQLAKEYNPDTNDPPADKIIAGTSRRLPWKCSVCSHKWMATGSDRTQGSGCPACYGRVPSPTNNMAITHPNLAAEYYPDSNDPPADKILAGTNKKLRWKCLAYGHVWLASGNSRVQSGCGCPACAGKAASPTNNMLVTHPHLAKEYNPGPNDPPADKIIAGTDRKIPWKCSKCDHEWLASGNSRVFGGNGCPACANMAVSNRNNMAVTHPNLAAEYYPGPNDPPADKIIAGTNKKLPWKCSICGHEWVATGNNRAQGRGCPNWRNHPSHSRVIPQNP